jgi:molybdopterin converting factor small subunit
MELRILFFSVLRDIVEAEEIVFEAPAGVSDVRGMLEGLYAKWPGLREWDSRIRVAVDLEYVDRGHSVAEGQEIAVMPPVQGG